MTTPHGAGAMTRLEFERLRVNVAAALDDLCRAAEVAPANPTDEAGRAVLDRLAALEVRGERSCPAGCAVAEYLRAACSNVPRAYEPGGVAVLVLLARVLLRATLEPDERTEQRTHHEALVPLPAAVQAAVRLANGDKRITREAA